MNEREMEQIASLVAERLRAVSGGTGAVSGGKPRGAARRASPAVPANPTTPLPPGTAAVRPAAPRPQSTERVADYIDHTLLKAEAARVEIEQLCDEAAEHRFAAVCVNGTWVRLCADRLRGTGVKVATVVGFPLGAATSGTKAHEASELVRHGADELDMVAAIGHIVDGDWDYVEDDIRAVVQAADGRHVKVILETATLEPLQIVKASAIAMEAGADFVKSSTGFHPAGGATAEAVALMRLAVGDRLGVKAAGGVRDCATALRMIASGANRIGTSSGVTLVVCMGAGPRALAELLSDPDGHERTCAVGGCDGVDQPSGKAY